MTSELRSAGGPPGVPADLSTLAPGTHLIALYHDDAELARTEGFPGLRVAMEMGDFTHALGSIERVMAWERMTTRLQHEQGISSVCQYDQRQLGGERSGSLSAAHAGAAPESAPRPQASFLATPDGLRITGEVDTANRARFVRALCARLAAIHQLTVDVRELTFIDAGTVGELHRIVDGLPAGGHISLVGAAPQLRRVVEIVDWPQPRLTIDPVAP